MRVDIRRKVCVRGIVCFCEDRRRALKWNRVSARMVSSAGATVSADGTLPISPNPRKQPEAKAHHHKFFAVSMELR